MANAVTSNDQTNLFYKKNYSRLLFLLRLMILINLGLVIALLYFMSHIPPPAHYSLNNEKPAPLYALDEPIVSQAELLNWAAQAAVAAYNYSFINYSDRLKEASVYFTKDGWSNFQRVLQPHLNTVISKKLIVSAVAIGPPVITKQGALMGHYSWSIRLPLLVAYEAAGGEKQQQALIIDMVIMRVPTLTTPRGIGIVQFSSYATSLSSINP